MNDILAEYKRQRYDKLSPVSKKMLAVDREYQCYVSMTWERDFYRAELEKITLKEEPT